MTDQGAGVGSAPTQAEGQMSVPRVRHLVVDSGAIIKEVPLHSLADSLWTVPDVIEEIKDKRARHVLESLPKRMELREPSQEAMNFIIQFSRKTGDFRSISNADIKVCPEIQHITICLLLLVPLDFHQCTHRATSHP